ncbi:MAG: DUF350 domain-containing protein [Chloroflexota bacterium]
MDVAAVISSILSSAVWAVVGVLLLIFAVRVFDWIDPVPYRQEVQKGNVAAGVVLGALIIGMAIIVFAAIR